MGNQLLDQVELEEAEQIPTTRYLITATHKNGHKVWWTGIKWVDDKSKAQTYCGFINAWLSIRSMALNSLIHNRMPEKKL